MRDTTVKKFQDFFAGKEVTFYDQEIEDRDRLLAIMDLKIKEIFIPDREVFKKIKKTYNVSYPTILKDIMIIERMIANERDPKGDPMKVFVRYFIGEIAKEAIKKAREKNDGYTMAYAANIMGKHYLTDKEDMVKPNYDDIVPFMPELTFDPSVIGITPLPNIEEIRKKYLNKYESEYQSFVSKLKIPDAEIIEENED